MFGPCKVFPSFKFQNYLVTNVPGRFDKMESLFQSMEGSLCKLDISTYNTLVGVYAQAGFIEKAEEVFASISLKGFVPDAMSWTSLMGAYAKRRLYRKCVSIFQKMCRAGCIPDSATAKVLFSSCRSPEQAQEVESMIEKISVLS